MSLTKTGLVLWYDGIRNVSLYSPHSTNNATWYDLSGNNNHGAITSGNWQDDALIFTEGSTYVIMGQHNYPYITYECVVEFTTLKSSQCAFFVNFESGGCGFACTTTYTSFQVYIGGYYKANLSQQLPLNQKHHLIGTYDGTTAKLYINGVLSASVTISGAIETPTSDTAVALGGNPKGTTVSSPSLNGKIYSARIYSRALTQAEVTQNYNYEMTGKYLGRKFLVKSKDILYTVQNNALVKLSETSITSQVFSTYGSDSMIDSSLIQNLVNPQILFWQEDETENLPTMTVTVEAIPHPQTLLAEEFYIDDSSIKGVESVESVYTGSPLIALSFDGGEFEYYDGTSEWVVASESEGMIPGVMTAIETDTWSDKITDVESIQIRVVLSSADDSLTSIKFNFIQ